MSPSEPQFLTVGTGKSARRIACLKSGSATGAAPGYFWLSGFKSDMASTKASALAARAEAVGVPCVRFDYSGHGLSGGRFEEGTIGRWLEEALEVFRAVSEGPQIIVGSSMGGHIALLLLRTLVETDPENAARVRALVLIAPAWDMTEELMWNAFDERQKNALVEQGVVYRPSDYGEPYALTRTLIEEGRQHLIATRPFDPGRPVLVLQGGMDRDVPADHVRRLPALLPGGHVSITEIPDGEHRLSRPGDLAELFRLIDRAASS
ncbi:MAG: alpha/beta hydrolase [Hyphomicrobium sp.]|nr:alpha/beta hydrolase [Hyphomicrobium sp.]